MNLIPFIYLFNNCSGHYFFDVNRNKIIEITPKLYDYLFSIINGHKYEVDNELEEIINNLKEKGYLSTNRINKIGHPLSNYINDFLENNINNVVFQVSQNCNLRCGYCPYSGDGVLTRKHSNKRMSPIVAYKSIDFVEKHSKNACEMTFGFYGGEPLLEFSLIKTMVNELNTKFFNRKINYTMTTNGTIINKEIIEFLYKNNFQLTISLDGNKEIHDFNRKYAHNGDGSFDKIYKNLRYIKEVNYDYFKTIQINSVTSSDIDAAELIDFFENDPLLRELKININNVSDLLLDKKYGNASQYDNTLHFKNLLNLIMNRQINISNRQDSLNKYDFNLKSNLPRVYQHSGPCLTGFDKLFINVDGEFLPCESASEKSKHMYIGNVNNGFNRNNIYRLMNIGQMTEEKCKNCICIRHCSICPIAVDNVSDLSLEYKKYICKNKYDSFINSLNEFTILKKVGAI